MTFERFTAAYRRVLRPGILFPDLALGLLMMWILVSGGSPRYGTGQALRASRQPAPGKPQKPNGASLLKPDPNAEARLAEAYGILPLSFEANRGQADRKVNFLARGRTYTLFLTPNEAVLSFRDVARAARGARNLRQTPTQVTGRSSQDHADAAHDHAPVVVRMKLAGANPAPEASALDPLPGTANYFIGNDPKNWRTRIPTYGRVLYKNVYPGTDLAYYGNQGHLEYDFVLKPGAAAKAIRLNFEGGNVLKLDAQGNLALGGAGNGVRFEKPRVYQEIDGKKHRVSGRYVLQGPRQVGFEVASYDISRPLIIDPSLSYSTYLGSTNFDQANGIAVDASGNAYVAGFTRSSAFPTSAGAFDTTYGSAFDGFVSKLSPTGSLVYSTYIGGGSTDHVEAVAVDAHGSAYVTGQTLSSSFPTTAGAPQPSYKGSGDAFVARLSADGSSLVYSTYLGGRGIDEGRGIAVDLSGNAYVTGKTYSTDLLSVNALQSANKGNGDAFVAELNSSGSLVYSTYLGGSGSDQANSIAVDLAGNAYVTGATNSSDFAVANAPQGACKSCPNVNDAFVAEISAGGSGLVYSTYLGGGGDDQGMAVAVDLAGNAYVTGSTLSTDFPTTSGAYQTSLLGGSSAFVTKVNANGSSLGYSTYLGGNNYTYGQGIALLAGIAYVTGTTNATTFPAVNAIQSSRAGLPDAFLTELNATGSSLYFSTYLGGSSFDEANAVALDPLANAYLAGDTKSTNFPSQNAFQGAFGGGDADAFIAKALFPTTVSSAPNSLNFDQQTVGTTSSPQAVTLSNTGTAPLGITTISFTGPNTSEYAQTNSCQPAVAPEASCTINVTFSPTSSGSQSAQLQISDNASGSPQSVGLSGNGVASGVSVSPASLAFGNQQVGTTSAPQAVTFSNTSNGTVSINSIAFSGGASGDFAEANNCGGSVAAGSSCTINVTFTPSATGTRSSQLAITDNASGSPQQVSVSGTGTAPGVQLSPTSLNFGNQAVNTTGAPQAVTLTNSGSSALTISSISITGTNSGDFAQTNNCPLSPSTLAASTSCTINVTFTPTATGARSGTLSVADNAAGSPQTASLTGTGTAPSVSLSPASVSFGSQAVNTTSAAQAVTLTNSGGSALTISSISITGTNSGDFAQTNNCPLSPSTLAASTSCTINVTFTPTATGARSGTLSVADNAAGSPQTASLSGTGVIPTGSGLAVVQVQNNIDSNAANFYASFPVNITTNPGHLLVAFVRESSNGTDNFTVTDSAGQTWTQTSSGYENESSAGPRSGMFYVANSAAVTSVTAKYTTSGGVIKPGIMVMEISGAAISAVADGSVNNASGASVHASSSGSLTTTNANDILIFATETGTNETGWTAGAGYTIPSNNLATGANGSNLRMAMQYAVAASALANTTTTTNYLNTSWNSNVFAAFKAAP